MARKFAKLQISIWNDDDYLDLSMGAQWLYKHLLTHPDLSYCGVVDWRPGRIAPKARDCTVPKVLTFARELTERNYLVIDLETEEAMVRTFVRNDELLKQKNMGVAVAKAHAAVASRKIRGVVIWELQRLRKENKEWTSWEDLKDLLKRDGVNPFENPSINPFENGLTEGIG